MLSFNQIYSIIQKAVNISSDIKQEEKVYDVCAKFGNQSCVDWNEIAGQINTEIADAKKLQNDAVLSSFIGKHISILTELKHYANLQNTQEESVWAKRMYYLGLASPITSLCLNQLLRSNKGGFFDFNYKGDDFFSLFMLFLFSIFPLPISSCFDASAKIIAEDKEHKKSLTTKAAHVRMPTPMLSTSYEPLAVKLKDLATSNLNEINEISKKYELKHVQIPYETQEYCYIPPLNNRFYLQRAGEIAFYTHRTSDEKLIKRILVGIATSLVSSICLYLCLGSKSCTEKAEDYFGKETLKRAFNSRNLINLNHLGNKAAYNEYLRECHFANLELGLLGAGGALGGFLFAAVNAAALFHKKFYGEQKLSETVLEKIA